jgi:glucose/arabinose dehydrogenase
MRGTPLKRFSVRRSGAGALLAALVVLLVGMVSAGPSAAVSTSMIKINFQSQAATTPAGYTADYGQAYDETRGYGWINAAGTPVDLTGNGRDRGTPTDRRLATFMHMQLANNATTHSGAGGWQLSVPNGTYSVGLSVGDGGKTNGAYCCLDSVDRLTVEGVLAVNNFQPTTAAPFFTTTVVVSVTDGLLTIDPSGGINDKINYVDVASSTDSPLPPSPQITGVTPASGAPNVNLNSSVSLAVNTPLDPSTVDAQGFQLIGPSGQVQGSYNSDAAGGVANFTPSANLEVNAKYTVQTTSTLHSSTGASFAAFSSTFTTGTAPPPLSPNTFTVAAKVSVGKPGVMVLSPDGKALYVGTSAGKISRFPRNADGSLGTPETITPFADRIILGLAFDPADSTKLWVTNNYDAYTNAPRFSGRVSTITIAPSSALSAATATATDRIIGLPRSAHDHMTNGLAFGPDGKLYIGQGADTAYGAADPYWGPRGEVPLSASILVADVHNAAFPATLNVNTDPVETTEDTGSATPVAYDPTTAAAPLKVFAYGVRNPFSLVWGSNGSLYAPVNESAAGGATPAGPNNIPPAVKNVQAYSDYFTRIDGGSYYGHPNPSQGYYALNGGNPTNMGDLGEVIEYPVGVQPDPNWRAPDLLMGIHRSPDGVTEYKSSTAFGGTLKGAMLTTEYSSGDDIVAVTLDANGKATSEAAIPDASDPGQALIFNNPLGIASDPTTGVVYVSEYGDESNPNAGDIAVLTPGTTTQPPPLTNPIKINFQPDTAPIPPGYTKDIGAAFNGTSGWTNLSGAPLDLFTSTLNNTRDRNSLKSPDQRYDTFIHMQAPSGSGVTTPGEWKYVLPNGEYDVHVVVGDPTAINSAHTINAESGTPDAVTLIDKFTPTTTNLWGDATKRVTVGDGALILDSVGGTNTKLDFVDITPVTASTPDTIAPTASIDLSGSHSGASSFTGDTTATITANDNVGVTSTTYSLDGLADKPYTVPIVVTTDGQHTLTVRAEDAAGNVGTATTTWDESHAAPPPLTTPVKINFQPTGTAIPTGYIKDIGAAFTTGGSGWADMTGAPLDLTANTRERKSSKSPDKLHDTMILMQAPVGSGINTVGQWLYTLPNGKYNVRAVVGDATALNSANTINAESGTPNAVMIINKFVPTSTNLYADATRQVTVSDGVLNLDPVGGTNTKLDFVEISPVTDTTAPTPVITLMGPNTDPSTFTGDTTATVSATDDVGVTSTTYSLDGSPDMAYTMPVIVTTDGSHTLTVAVTDAAVNIGTTSATWMESHTSLDTTAPTVSIALTGANTDPSTFTDDTTATVTATDDVGVTSATYSLDNAADVPYTAPLVVAADGSHTLTVTAMDAAGNIGTATTSWTETHPVVSGPPVFAISSPDDQILAAARPRLIFSTSQAMTTPARAYTITNSGTGDLNITGLSISGTNSSSFRLAPSQPTSFTVPAGGTAQVSVLFTPTAPTNCPSQTGVANSIGTVERYAALTLTTNDTTTPTSTVDLAGINACGVEGGNEPVLAQVARVLGYTTKVQNGTTDQRFLGATRSLAASDEVQAPYFQPADSSQPVTINPVSHYSGRTVTTGTFLVTGWYLKSAAVKTPCQPANGCHTLFGFDGDQAAPGPYTENQKLMPAPDGVTTFSPTGPFGIYNGDYSGINFTDDGKNAAETISKAVITPPHYLHSIRVYPAYGPNRTLIPNTWILAVDITRQPNYKNNDFQDAVFILRNAKLDTSASVQPGAAGTNLDLTTGGAVSAGCAATGFSGVMENTAGNQCNPANISFGPTGLQLTSTAGQMGGPSNNQQDALYKNFDASRTPFTVQTRVVGPITSLTTNYQQIGAFFGPDQDNYVKVEAEHNGSGADPHLTMFYEEGGAAGTVQTVSVPALTTASTLDLIIKGNTSVPDPTAAGSDTNNVRNYPLDQLTVYYSLNNGAPVQIGVVKSPADVTRWFSTSARAGILVSGAGSNVPFTTTFNSFSIKAG